MVAIPWRWIERFMGCFWGNIRKEWRWRSVCTFDNLRDPLDRQVAYHSSSVIRHGKLKVTCRRARRRDGIAQLFPRAAAEAIRNARASVLGHERRAVVIPTTVCTPRTGRTVKSVWDHRKVPAVQICKRHRLVEQVARTVETPSRVPITYTSRTCQQYNRRHQGTSRTQTPGP